MNAQMQTTDTLHTNHFFQYSALMHWCWMTGLPPSCQKLFGCWQSTNMLFKILWKSQQQRMAKLTLTCGRKDKVYVLPLKRRFFPISVCKRTPCYLCHCQVYRLLEISLIPTSQRLIHFLESVQFVKVCHEMMKLETFCRQQLPRHTCSSLSRRRYKLIWVTAAPWWNTFYLPPS